MGQRQKHFVNRLGLTGPRNENQTPMNSHFFDASDVCALLARDYDPNAHGYHFHEGPVAKDIRAVLKGVATGDRKALVFVNYKNVHRLTK